MTRDADGFRPGTNYIHRARGRFDPAAEIAAVLAQRAACARGEHKTAIAELGQVTRIGGRPLNPHTVYCSYCKRVKGEPGWDPILADNGQQVTETEAALIGALSDLAGVWTAALQLVSMDGQLCVIHTTDLDKVMGYEPGISREARQALVLARICGIPNDGGSWYDH